MNEYLSVFIHVGFFVSVTRIETSFSDAGIEMTVFQEKVWS